MRRQQELPEEAFFSADEAAALLDRADRSVLVLSHRWHTAEHPDPSGATLDALRRHLRANELQLSECGLFIECAAACACNLTVHACGLDSLRALHATI